MKILFYRSDHSANVNRKLEDGYGGVGYYRIVQPAKYVQGHEVEVVGVELTKKGESRDKRWNRIFKDYDVFWTSYFYDDQEASSMFYHRDKYKKKVVIDLDDNYFDILPSHYLYDKLKPTKKARAICSTILSFADVITVSTLPLKQKLDEHMQRVYGLKKTIIIIPNMNQMEDWYFPSGEKDPTKIVIGYTGSNSHYDDLKMVFPAVARIMDKYSQVYFEIMGSLGESDAIQLFSQFSHSAQDRSSLIPSTSTFKEYPEHLAKTPWNIGIAPLADGGFTRCKTPIKYFEYSMFKIPTIASDVYPYSMPYFNREVIPEDAGILVKPNEWFSAIEDLILNKDKRIKIGENAYNHVTKNWQYSKVDFGNRVNEVVECLFQ